MDVSIPEVFGGIEGEAVYIGEEGGRENRCGEGVICVVECLSQTEAVSELSLGGTTQNFTRGANKHNICSLAFISGCQKINTSHAYNTFMHLWYLSYYFVVRVPCPIPPGLFANKNAFQAHGPVHFQGFHPIFL